MSELIMGLTKQEYGLFCKILNSCSSYFEFGAGHSTVLADGIDNIVKVVSVDSCPFWIDDVSKRLKTTKVRFIPVDINAGTNYGYPLDKSKINNWPSYSKAVMSGFDVYFVDGRFRVACCLKVWEKMPDGASLLVHDYGREEYHVIEQFFNKIEQVDCLALFQKKDADLSKVQEMYEKYKLVTK